MRDLLDNSSVRVQDTCAGALPNGAPPTEFEWRVATGRWRWLLLASIGGVVAGGCGGSARDGQQEAEATAAGLGGSAAAARGRSARGLGGEGQGAGIGQGAAGGSAAPPGTSMPPPATPRFNTDCTKGEAAYAGDDGWRPCGPGVSHRSVPRDCSSKLPRAMAFDSITYQLLVEQNRRRTMDPDAGPSFECEQDTDCTAKPHGYCALEYLLNDVERPYCAYGCVTDADCPTYQMCQCGSSIGNVIGTCTDASCRSDANCSGDSMCVSRETDDYHWCNGFGPRCQSAQDECLTDADCGPGTICNLSGEGSLRCLEPGGCPVPGRPFIVAGAQRVAGVVARSEWSHGAASPSRPTPSTSSEDAALHSAVAEGWLQQALMEHASVAAFARFALELLSFGAPAELVSGAAQAMQDEIRHAEGCFALARRYSGRDLGPGPLPVAGALEHTDLRMVVLSTLHEGCIGETLAALEAAEALAHCEDPAARALLERIAAEEAQHAQLAWRFVAWALAVAPGLREPVARAFAAAQAAPATEAPPSDVRERDLLRHGLFTERLRQALHARVLREVIAPCAEALLAGHRLVEVLPLSAARLVPIGDTASVLDDLIGAGKAIPPRLKGPLPAAVAFGDPASDSTEVVRAHRDEV